MTVRPIPVAQANINKRLRGKRLHRAITAATRGRQIVCVQEAESDAHVAALATVHGLDAYFPDGAGRGRTVANACPILYDAARFRRLDAGSVIIGQGIAHVQPDRPANWVLLADRESRMTVAVISAHTVSGVWRNLARTFAAWAGRTRRQESDHELDELAALTGRLAKRADVVIGAGDLNRRAKLHAARLGAEHVVYAAHPTHGRSWYDLLWLVGAEASGVRAIGTPSDHDVLAATVTPVTDTPPEPPTKETTVAHGFMPGAINKNIAPGSNDPQITPAGVICHVAVSHADSLRYLFTHDGGIESHFYVRDDGGIEQYRSIFSEADAQSQGNSFGSPRRGFVSIETEGMGPGRWSAAQIASILAIIAFVHGEAPFALRKCPGPFAEGVGYHRQFREWNPNSHSCPGDARIEQFDQTIVPRLRQGAARLTEEDDVQLNEDIAYWKPGDDKDHDKTTVGKTLNQARGYAEACYELLQASIDPDAWADRVAARINVKANLSAADVKQAVKDALAEGVE